MKLLSTQNTSIKLLSGVMNNNKLFIAAAGSGKTTFLVNEALKIKDETVLITTYTEFNELEIKNKITKKVGYIPSNITIQTWFSFLLQHGVRPFQSALDDSLHDVNLGFHLSNKKSGFRYQGKRGPVYYGKDNFNKYFFTSTKKINSDKISIFILDTNVATNGAVIDRLSKIYKNIYIDEIQDLAGYDLDIVKELFKSNINTILVGDPRQVTYATHHSAKYKKYSNGKIKDFIENELGRRLKCTVDEETLSASHRNNQLICDYSAKLYSTMTTPAQCQCENCHAEDSHKGIFAIRPSEVAKYHKRYNDVKQLCWSTKSKADRSFSTMNMGASKGATFNRVLIYPTKAMISWTKDNTVALTAEARAKFYVALTRARLSATIVIDYEEDETLPEVQKFKFNE